MKPCHLNSIRAFLNGVKAAEGNARLLSALTRYQEYQRISDGQIMNGDLFEIIRYRALVNDELKVSNYYLEDVRGCIEQLQPPSESSILRALKLAQISETKEWVKVVDRMNLSVTKTARVAKELAEAEGSAEELQGFNFFSGSHKVNDNTPKDAPLSPVKPKI